MYAYILELVNEPNISYRFEHIFKYRYGILKKSNIEISEFRYQLQYGTIGLMIILF